MPYPDPLPSSGQLSLGEIKAWMEAAGEWPADDPPNFFFVTSLDNAVTYSHLSDKSTPYQISDFYGYGIPPTYAIHYISTGPEESSFNACSIGVDNVPVYTDPANTFLTTFVQVFTDTSLTTPVEGGYYYYSESWIQVDASGIIVDMGSC